jgi:hypothetical protein
MGYRWFSSGFIGLWEGDFGLHLDSKSATVENLDSKWTPVSESLDSSF